MKIEINLLPPLAELCPYCFGSGKQKAMQMAMTYDAGIVRTEDTLVKCLHCNGRGLRSSN